MLNFSNTCNIVVIQRIIGCCFCGTKPGRVTNIIIQKKPKIIIHNIQKWHEFVFQVNITVQSVVVQSLNGMRTLLNGSDVLRLPMILDELCINIVLGVGMTVLFLFTFDGKHVRIKSLLIHKLQRCEKGLAQFPYIVTSPKLMWQEKHWLWDRRECFATK